jgi:uncharacterized protein
MPPRKAQPQPTGPQRNELPPTVSARWLLTAASLAIAAAAACAWLTLCLLFWQGSWQLLYHPKSEVTRTPARNFGLPFDSVGFATTQSGAPQLHGWWIPYGPESHYTAIYLHGADGNLGDIGDALIPLRGARLNIFAFDYRGYGMSSFERPSEAHWREDAESAIEYLTNTRHIPASSLLLVGQGLGANLALEVAAAHPELAGVVLNSPLNSPVDAIFSDPRARLVPARLLVRDRFNADKAANALLIPSLWLIAPPATSKIAEQPSQPNGYDRIAARKTLVWLPPGANGDQVFAEAFRRWLDDLPGGTGAP